MSALGSKAEIGTWAKLFNRAVAEIGGVTDARRLNLSRRIASRFY
jgi:hypothetical protein